MQRILVTGSSGFLGGHLVGALQRLDLGQIVGVSRKSEITISQVPRIKHFQEVFCDLEDEFQVAQLMKEYKPDVVYHLGGIAKTKRNEKDPTDVFRANALSTQYLLNNCRPETRFVYASSCAVYGDYSRQGLAVRHCTEDTPVNPTSLYGVSKLAGENSVSVATRQGLVRGVSLRLVANVGLGATHGLLPDLIKKLQSESKTLKLYGDGLNYKPYCHVDDTIHALVELGESAYVGKSVVVSPEDSLYISQVADLVMKTMRTEKEIEWLPKEVWAGDNLILQAKSVRKLKGLDFAPSRSSEQAIQEAVGDILGWAKIWKVRKHAFMA